jgi:protein phosphatase PTC2/3
MGTNGKTVAMSHDHKPTNVRCTVRRPVITTVQGVEQKRIEAAGGSVTLGRVNGDLAVSRALGDFSYKQCAHLGPCEQQVSAHVLWCAERHARSAQSQTS